MGFRSTFVTEDYAIRWPLWFRERYADTVRFPENSIGALHSIEAAKVYGRWETLHEDIQKAIEWNAFPGIFSLVYLHECGGVTRCQIEKDSIRWSEPIAWRATEGVEHHYCYGCSDVDKCT